MQTRHLLNTVCPYYTMFPLDFPLRVLKRARDGDVVADPYCGRGTTVYAARTRGLACHGIDTSPVAVAVSRAKLASTTLVHLMRAYDRLMESVPEAEVPGGEFWALCYHPQTLAELCRLRTGLNESLKMHRQGESGAVVLLRAIVLGALHGPLRKGGTQGIFFSNQMMRTFAAKPDYAVRFWRRNNMTPNRVDVRAIIRERATRILNDAVPPAAPGHVIAGDSRDASTWRALNEGIRWVVTSPPYYGMRTYEEDQWLRIWFLGGPDRVQYGNHNQLPQGSQEMFAASMAQVWDRIGELAHKDILMAVRFGAIGSRKSDYRQIMQDSLAMSRFPWRLLSTRAAGTADHGRRQSLSMGAGARSSSIEERDFYVSFA